MLSSGVLEIICGPMFSGKSEELIRRLRRTIIARQNVIICKYALDTRFSSDHVVSHNGTKIQAHSIETGEELATLLQQSSATVLGIDEIQFFSSDIIPIIMHAVHQGIRVIGAGLDLDFRGMPFGPMPTLLTMADTVTKLHAICCICGNDAHHTQRLVNNSPAQYNDPLILIGAQENYQARCRRCYQIDHYAFVTNSIPDHDSHETKVTF